VCGTFLGSGNAAINYWPSIEQRPSPWLTHTIGCRNEWMWNKAWAGMIIKAKRFSVTHGMLLMNCFNPPPPLKKKNSPVTATSYRRKTRSFVLVPQNIIIPRRILIQQCTFPTWHRKYRYLYVCKLYVRLTVTRSLKAKSRTHFSSCSTHERNVKGQIKHGHDLYASAAYLTIQTHTNPLVMLTCHSTYSQTLQIVYSNQ